MAKIRITMEAEIEDLDGYWPNNPKGITQENVFHVVKEMSLAPMEKLMDLYASPAPKTKHDKIMRDASEKIYRQEEVLTKRLVDSLRMEVIE